MAHINQFLSSVRIEIRFVTSRLASSEDWELYKHVISGTSLLDAKKGSSLPHAWPSWTAAGKSMPGENAVGGEGAVNMVSRLNE